MSGNSSSISGLLVTMETDKAGLTSFPYAEVTWSKPESGYGAAVVSVKKSGEADSEYREKGRFGDSARIDGLVPGVGYDFKVEAFSSSGSALGAALESVDNVAGRSGEAPGLRRVFPGRGSLETWCGSGKRVFRGMFFTTR